MANALALDNPIRTQLEEQARELALCILADDDPAKIKAMAANVLRYFF